MQQRVPTLSTRLNGCRLVVVCPHAVWTRINLCFAYCRENDKCKSNKRREGKKIAATFAVKLVNRISYCTKRKCEKHFGASLLIHELFYYALRELPRRVHFFASLCAHFFVLRILFLLSLFVKSTTNAHTGFPVPIKRRHFWLLLNFARVFFHLDVWNVSENDLARFWWRININGSFV